GVLFVKYKEKLNKLTLSIILFFLSMFGYSIFQSLKNLSYSVMYRFGDRTTFIEDSARLKIIEAYIKKIDFPRLFFGLDFQEHNFAGFTNLHNSYLSIHSMLGLGGILVIITLLITLISFIK